MQSGHKPLAFKEDPIEHNHEKSKLIIIFSMVVVPKWWCPSMWRLDTMSNETEEFGKQFLDCESWKLTGIYW